MCLWKREAKAIRRDELTLYGALVNETKAKVKQGKCPDCFLIRMIEDQKKQDISDEWLGYIAALFVSSSPESTLRSLSILTLIVDGSRIGHDLIKCTGFHSGHDCPPWHPQESTKGDRLPVQRSAKVSRCEGQRLSKCHLAGGAPPCPSLSKLANLTSLFQTLRWRPVAPGGIPHTLIQDDNYEGYFIPKGAMLFANAWTIHCDEKEYLAPGDFYPERWLGNRYGTIGPEVKDEGRREMYGFGAGRWLCSGQMMAENSMITILQAVFLLALCAVIY